MRQKERGIVIIWIGNSAACSTRGWPNEVRVKKNPGDRRNCAHLLRKRAGWARKRSQKTCAASVGSGDYGSVREKDKIREEMSTEGKEKKVGEKR
ncbi:unnamed protein product [Dovyalis caffra]|uniref:Uncharacterized protein n=1 Tax=Dovyalis caffra TaxID=77055 RepID=A0AAV1RAU7_9ROSI|nr:unnamed protein product [Dovyalis caffra]